jgi:GT2 family glycosyltransferase
LKPTYIAELMAAVERTGAAFAYSDMQLIDAGSGVFCARPFSLFALARANYVNASALTRRDAYLRAGGYRVPAPGDYRHGHDDWDLWLRLAQGGYTGVYVGEPLLEYRRHAGGSRNRELASEWPLIVSIIRGHHPWLYRSPAFRVAERQPFLRAATWLSDRRSERVRRALDRALFGFRRTPPRSETAPARAPRPPADPQPGTDSG